MDDMEECFNFFLLGLYDHSVPVRSMMFRKPLPPLLTDSVKALILDKDEACRRVNLQAIGILIGCAEVYVMQL